ncbi:hypothetical protein Tco_0593357 [Tanacetum coccineum]
MSNAFTARISDFPSENKKRLMPANVKTYEGKQEARVTGSANYLRRSIDGLKVTEGHSRLNFTRRRSVQEPCRVAMVKQRPRRVHKRPSRAHIRTNAYTSSVPRNSQDHRSFIQGEAAAADSRKGYSNNRSHEQSRRQSNDQSSIATTANLQSEGRRGETTINPTVNMTPNEIQQQKVQTSQGHHQCALQKSNAWGTDTIGSPDHHLPYNGHYGRPWISANTRGSHPTGLRDAKIPRRLRIVTIYNNRRHRPKDATQKNKSCHPTTFTAHDEKSSTLNGKLAVSGTSFLSSQQTIHSLVQNTQEVYEEGRLPLDYRSRRSFHAAQAAYSSTSHASRTPTRGGVDNIFIRDAWGN